MNISLRISLLNVTYAFLCVSSLLISLLFHFYENIPVYFIAIKDVVIYSSIFVALLVFKVPPGLSKYVSSIIPIAIILLLSFVMSDAPEIAKIASIRQIINLYAIILLAYLLVNNFRCEKLFYRWQFFVVFFVLLFGFFEWSSEIWRSGVLFNYFSSKNIPVNSVGYPYFFLEPLSSLRNIVDREYVIRMTSTFLDPINLGHALVFWFVLLKEKAHIVRNEGLRKGLMLCILIALFLTFSKGAWLQLLLILFVFDLFKSIEVRVFLLFLVALLLNVLANYHAGVAIHVSGFNESISSVTLMGYGLGMAGNYASMFSSVKEVMIGDTYIGALLGQIGVVGLVAWLYPIFLILKKIERLSSSISIKIIVTQIFISLFSENAFNLLSIFNISLLIGIELRLSEIRYRYYKKMPVNE